MGYRDDNLCFGKVRSIDGSKVVIKIEELLLEVQDEKYQVEVGALVNCGGLHGDTICMIDRIRIQELEKKGELVEMKIAEMTILGSKKKDGKLTRGVDYLPPLNCSAYFIPGDKLNNLLGVEIPEDKQDFSKYIKVGTRSMKNAGDVYLDMDKLLGRHVAILGTTGSGKSCTVASIVQSILKQYPYPRLIFFDVHNEYAAAFSGEWNSKTHLLPWEDYSLPYWYLDLEEFKEIYNCSGIGPNQEAKLKEWITELKQEHVKQDSTVTVDSPIYFSIDDLLEKITQEIEGLSSTNRKSFESMKMKIDSINNDKRFYFLRKDIKTRKELAEYFIDLFGLTEQGKYLSILDLSGIPSEVRTTCVGVLSRLCFDFSYWDADPENLPLALVLEEAHNYIPEESSADFNLCKKRIEKIAKEGRKYGISLMVVTQRPSNVSTTVLSQCGTYITLRLTNDIDQNKIKRLLPDTLGEQANILPSLRDGEALISGDGINLPGKVRFTQPNPEPKSNDVRYHHSWSIGVPEHYNVESIIKDWQHTK